MSKTSGELRVIPVPFPPEIKPSDPLVDKLANAIQRAKLRPEKGDILVVKHKLVSKAEGQLVELGAIRPSASAGRWGERFGVDARVTEVAVRQAKRVVRRGKGVLITETRHGLVCANSGVDVSNVDGGRHALLLPEDPDRSAAQLHHELKDRLKLSIPVIITDSFGRPWREGLTEAAIGVAGMSAL